LHLKQTIILFFAGVVAGTLNAVAGGGSFISFPLMLFTGVPPVEANASNTVALWPGLASSVASYARHLKVPRRLLIPLVVTSVIGGLAGALLLVKTPQRTFLHLVPWLLLGATLLFIFGNRLRAMAGKTDDARAVEATSWQAITLACILQLAVGTYGGYFGAGIGFVMLGMMTLVGMREIHVMNALRILLAAVINAAAVVTFIVTGAVFWGPCLVMMAGALSGGWVGAQYAQKADPRKMRWVIIALGLGLSAYFFLKTR
jgi:uncharacterized membrane protein YfcA